MHEIGLMMSILESVEESAREAGATRVTRIDLSVGEMTEAVGEALEFAFDALTEGTLCEGAQLQVEYVKPFSRCLDCGCEFEHDRYHLACPDCDSWNTRLLAGRDLFIKSIEVDLPDTPQDGAAVPGAGDPPASAAETAARTSKPDAPASGTDGAAR